jgi:RHS repeat-associated protein
MQESEARIVGQAGGTKEILFFHNDHLGTPIVVTDIEGMVVSKHRYSPFGEELAPEGSNSHTHRFTGHERDNDTGLDYMMARYYGPSLARFLSVDPGYDVQKSEPDSWNLYVYAGNNPLRFIDATGEGKVGFAIRTVKGIWNAVTSKVAQRAYARGKDVKVTGKGASGAAESLAKKAKGKNTPEGGNIVRHDGHQPGQDPHYQTQPGDGSHVRYDSSSTIIPGAGLGAAAGDAVEDATGSETAGDVAAFVIDLFNPLSDIEDVIDLVTPESETSEEEEATEETEEKTDDQAGATEKRLN